MPKSKTKKRANFQFHAMGDLLHDRYIFSVREKSTLKLLRLYDISDPTNVQKIHSTLLSQRKQWLAEGMKDERKMKRDVIVVKEKGFVEDMQFCQEFCVGECQVCIG